jgi:hypothetical protein
MAGRVNVKFAMTVSDLYFLRWAMEVLEGGPHDYEKECKEWGCRFSRALEDHLEEISQDKVLRTVSFGDDGKIIISSSDEPD